MSQMTRVRRHSFRPTIALTITLEDGPPSAISPCHRDPYTNSRDLGSAPTGAVSMMSP